MSSSKAPALFRRRTENLFESQIDEEKVLFDTQTGDTVGLSKVGTAIWNELEEPTDIETLCWRLVGLYNVTYEQCFKETSNFIDQLIQKELIVCH